MAGRTAPPALPRRGVLELLGLEEEPTVRTAASTGHTATTASFILLKIVDAPNVSIPRAARAAGRLRTVRRWREAKVAPPEAARTRSVELRLHGLRQCQASAMT